MENQFQSGERESDDLLRVRNLSKHFGEIKALDSITFDIRKHEIVGLIGPNGAGKTTLLEGMTGLMPLDRGEIFREDTLLPVSRRRRTMFYLPDCIIPYPELPVGKAIDFWARFLGAEQEKFTEIIQRLELETVQFKRINSLSKGYRRRFLLAISLLSSQSLLILDEPFDGLDLRQMLTIIAILKETRAAGRTLLLSIHQLYDAERICDRFLLLNAGRMLGFGTLPELRKQAGLSAGNLEDVFLALT